jgi:hypothetical protein
MLIRAHGKPVSRLQDGREGTYLSKRTEHRKAAIVSVTQFYAKIDTSGNGNGSGPLTAASPASRCVLAGVPTSPVLDQTTVGQQHHVQHLTTHQ